MNKTSIAAILAAIASVSFVNAESDPKQEVKQEAELTAQAGEAAEKTAAEAETKTTEETK